MTRHRASRLAWAVAVGASLLIAGCTSGDTSFYVKNDSGQAWYLKIDHGLVDRDLPSVVKVDPGAEGFALAWGGDNPVTVQVLAADCTVVDAFAKQADGVYQVAAVSGLTGHTETHGPPMVSRSQTPGIADSTDCGGFVGR